MKFIHVYGGIGVKKVYKCIIGIVLVLVFAFLALYNNVSIGVTESKIESDARRAHKIDDNWQVAKSISHPIGVLLFYDPKSNDSIYSIYLNIKGFSYGYRFLNGGSGIMFDKDVYEFNFDGYGKALISMNNAKIERIEIDNGQEVKKVIVDSKKPFTLALPGNYYIVTMYDVNNKVVSISSNLANN
jgi:hypothetical protein